MADQNFFYEEGKRIKAKGKLGVFVRRFFGLILVAIVVLGIVFTAMLQDSSFVDRLRRRLFYGESVSENYYTYAPDASNRYGAMGNLLVVLNQNSIQFLQDDGTTYFSKQIACSTPMLHVNGDYALAYDIGGENLGLFTRDSMVFSLQQDEEEPIISARLNQSGYLAVVTEKIGYKSVVSVYNSEQELVFDYNSSSRYIMDAVVTEDNKSLLIALLSQENGSFCTRYVRYALNNEEPLEEHLLTNHLTADLAYMGDTYCSLSDRQIAFLNDDGAYLASYDFGDLYLAGYSLGGDGFATLLLNRYQAGSLGTLLTIDETGELLGMKQINHEVLSLSACGEYVAVLSGSQLVVMNKKLEELSTLEDTGYADTILTQKDGTVLVMGGSSAARYVPS